MNVTVPYVDVTEAVLAIYPDAVCDVIKIFIPAVIIALISTLRPDNNVTLPIAELTAAEIVMSPAAPADVKLTLPYPPADSAPLTPIVPADAANVMLPVVMVVMPLVVKLPVAAVKLKFTPMNAAFTSVDVTLLTIAYVVSPSPPSKAMLCVVLTLAVTVKFARFPLPAWARYTSSVPKELSANEDAAPL